MITNIEEREGVKDKLWMNSIIEDSANWNVQLTIGGKYEDIETSWPECRSKEINPGQHFEMDYMTITEEGWKKVSIDRVEEVMNKISSQYRHQLKFDQAYLSSNGKIIFEILGVHGLEEKPELEVRIWEKTDNRSIQKGSIVKLSDLTPSCGMGCNMKLEWTKLFETERVKRIILSNDDYTYETTTRKVREVLNQNVPTTALEESSIWEILEEHRQLLEKSTIYTDGSWKDMRTKAEKLFRIGKCCRSSAAVVIISEENEWKDKVALTIRLTASTENVNEQLTKAFTMEAIGILAAAQIANWFKLDTDIITDCRGVLDKINYNYAESWANHGQVQILNAIRKLYNKKLKWTRSHPERRKKPNEYEKNDFGIAMADAICEDRIRDINNQKHVEEMMTELKNIKIYHYEVQIEDVLKEILKVADYAWTRENVPLVISIQSIRDNNRKGKYLEERDMWKRDSEGDEKHIWRKIQ